MPEAVLGRTCHNLSKNKNGHYLNKPETKLASDDRYGTVVLPSIEKIAQGIVELASKIGVPIRELVATKDDAKNAHNLNKYSRADARLTCTLLEGDITMIATRCVFGDNGAAQAFDCPARACDRLVSYKKLATARDSQTVSTLIRSRELSKNIRRLSPKYGAPLGVQTQ